MRHSTFVQVKANGPLHPSTEGGGGVLSARPVQSFLKLRVCFPHLERVADLSCASVSQIIRLALPILAVAY